jgi:hypothetical protein
MPFWKKKMILGELIGYFISNAFFTNGLSGPLLDPITLYLKRGNMVPR